MIFFKHEKTKSILAFLGRSGSTSFAKAFLGAEVFNNFKPSEGKATPHSLCEVCFKPRILNGDYPDYKIYAIVRHPIARFESAINHKSKPFQYFIDNTLDVHTKSAYELLKGLPVKAYKFENGGIWNCAKDMGIDNLEKLNSKSHIISLTEEEKNIVTEKYAKDIELWNSISENGTEIFLD
jgi:hypothetical protein